MTFVAMLFVVFAQDEAAPARPAISPARSNSGQLVPYKEGMTIPEGAVMVNKSNTAVWATGLGLLLSGYLLTGFTTTVACAYAPCYPSAVPVSWVPVAGPLINMPITALDTLPIMIITSAMQLTGAGLFIYGLAAPKRFLRLANAQLQPVVSPGYQGFALSGSF